MAEESNAKGDPLLEQIEQQYRSNIGDVTTHYRWMAALASAVLVASVSVCLLISEPVEFLEVFIGGWAVLVASVYCNIAVLNILLSIGAAMATPRALRSDAQEQVLRQEGRMAWFAKVQQPLLYVGSMLVLGASVAELLMRGV